MSKPSISDIASAIAEYNLIDSIVNSKSQTDNRQTVDDDAVRVQYYEDHDEDFYRVVITVTIPKNK